MNKTTEKSEKKIIEMPSYIQDVKGRRPKGSGKVTIPNYEDLPMVRGIFRNVEMPGTGFSFPYRNWKGPIKMFHLFDGCEYVIPRVVADHLNDNCKYKENKWISSEGITNAQPILIGGKGFQPTLMNATKEVRISQHRFMFQILGDA